MPAGQSVLQIPGEGQLEAPIIHVFAYFLLRCRSKQDKGEGMRVPVEGKVEPRNISWLGCEYVENCPIGKKGFQYLVHKFKRIVIEE